MGFSTNNGLHKIINRVRVTLSLVWGSLLFLGWGSHHLCWSDVHTKYGVLTVAGISHHFWCERHTLFLTVYVCNTEIHKWYTQDMYGISPNKVNVIIFSRQKLRWNEKYSQRNHGKSQWFHIGFMVNHNDFRANHSEFTANHGKPRQTKMECLKTQGHYNAF